MIYHNIQHSVAKRPEPVEMSSRVLCDSN